MSFITNLRADRIIAEIKATEEGGPTANVKALERLARLGASAIPRVIDALASADKQETAGFVERAVDAARRPHVSARRGGTRGRQPAHGGRGDLGALLRPQLPGQPALRTARTPADAEEPGRQHHGGAESAAQRARPAATRLQPGAGREGGDVPHHRRDRGRDAGARTDQPARRQGSDRPHPHHQHPVAIQPPGRRQGAAVAAEGLEQVHPPGRPELPRSPAGQRRRRPALRGAARPGRRNTAEGDRRDRAREPPGHHPVPGAGAAGRGRRRPPRGGRGAERDRHGAAHQASAAVDQGRRLVGARPRRRRARARSAARASSRPRSS